MGDAPDPKQDTDTMLDAYRNQPVPDVDYEALAERSNRMNKGVTDNAKP